MPYFESSQIWLTQSQLLLSARPSTRVTTTYTPNPVQKKRKPNPRKRKHGQSSDGSAPHETAEKSTSKNADDKVDDVLPPPPGTLTMKTYDPVTGVCLKYRTSKQQEVGRLMGAGGLASIAKIMVGTAKSEDVPRNLADVEKAQAKTGRDVDEDGDTKTDANDDNAVMDGDVDTKPAGHTKQKKSVSFAAEVEVRKTPVQPQQQPGGGGGGKKKKKKNR